MRSTCRLPVASTSSAGGSLNVLYDLYFSNAYSKPSLAPSHRTMRPPVCWAAVAYPRAAWASGAIWLQTITAWPPGARAGNQENEATLLSLSGTRLDQAPPVRQRYTRYPPVLPPGPSIRWFLGAYFQAAYNR